MDEVMIPWAVHPANPENIWEKAGQMKLPFPDLESACIYCGGNTVNYFHCVVCDQDATVCKCENYNWWSLTRCATCDAVWDKH